MKLVEKMEQKREDLSKRDTLGAMSAELLLTLVISLSVSLYMVAYLMAPALGEIASVNTTAWASGVAGIWPLIPLFAILAVALAYIFTAVRKRG